MFAVQERGDSFLRIVRVECPVLCGSNGIVNPRQDVNRQDHDELKSTIVERLIVLDFEDRHSDKNEASMGGNVNLKQMA